MAFGSLEQSNNLVKCLMEDLLKLYYSVSMKEDTLLKTETSNLYFKKKKKKKKRSFALKMKLLD